jgi:23S rRNA (uracil1939-C5)-methyltransferase
VCKEKSSGFVVFVDNALPGEEFVAKVSKKKKTYGFGEKIKTTKLHDGTCEPECAHFGACGGCSFQNLRYCDQIKWKENLARDAFERIGGIVMSKGEGGVFQSIQPSPQIYGYRNKMEFTVSKKNGDIGVRRKGSFEDIVDISTCKIHSEEADELYTTLRVLLSDKQEGIRELLEYVVIRWSCTQKHALINFVTLDDSSRELRQISKSLLERHECVQGIVNSIAKLPLAKRRMKSEILLHGSGNVIECLDGINYRISTNSFFQTNTQQTIQLYRHIVRVAKLLPTDIVYDLYCGAGTIGLFLARYVEHVYGIEISESSINDAKYNATENGISNATFILSDVAQGLENEQELESISPDIIVVDPARSGLSPRAILGIGKLAPRTIIYVSCNVATCTRDVQLLTEHGYAVSSVKPFDFFPHTPHVEVVTSLEKIES